MSLGSMIGATPITREVPLVVPAVAHEIYALLARVILTTVFGPVPLIPRRNVQIDRRRDVLWIRYDEHRLRIDHRWGRGQITDVDPSIKFMGARGGDAA